jgi:hypothetical protein
MRSFAFLACSMLLACGKVETQPQPDSGTDAPVENTDGLKSGTRLKIRWNVFDGTKSFAAVYDSARQETCTPRRFSDAKIYCTPTPTTNVVYRDAACTMPIGRQLISCPATPVNYFIETDPLTCDSLPVRIYPKAAQISLASYYTLSTTGCAMTSSTGYELFALGPQIPLTEFVTVEAPTTAEGKVQRRFYEASDGARMFAGVFDNELGSECFFVQDATKTSAKCVPSSVSASTYYGDAACTIPRAEFRTGCAVPKYATRPSAGLGCAFTSQVPAIHLTGPLLATLPLYSGGRCTLTSPRPDHSYYPIGAELIEPGQLTRAPAAQGSGRYRPIHYASGGNLIRDTWLYDTARQAECSPTTMQDGTVRCLPVGNPYFRYDNFADAGCTMPLAVIRVPNAPAAGCTLPPLPVFATRTVTTQIPTCTSTVEVRPVGAAYTGTLYSGTPAACSPVILDNETAYALASPTSLEDFPAALVETDP